MNKKKIVLKIGGSLLFENENKINSKKIIELCNILKNIQNYETIIVIIGGGTIAREYIRFIRNITKNESLSDIIGINVSRVNAQMIISCLEDKAFPSVPKSIEQLSLAVLSGKIIVMGGLQPGQSTTSVALEVAEFINAKEVVILTNVDGIYDKDPIKDKDAKKYDKLNYDELKNLIIEESDYNQAAAGEYRIFDTVSLQILKRSKITVLIGSGIDIKPFKKYWNGNIDSFGTIITEDYN